MDVPREQRQWELLIRVPEYVQSDLAESSMAEAAGNKTGLDAIARVAFESIDEGGEWYVATPSCRRA